MHHFAGRTRVGGVREGRPFCSVNQRTNTNANVESPLVGRHSFATCVRAHSDGAVCVFLGRFFARAFEITECKLMKMTANESVNEEGGVCN